jgi:hypothetical protein
MVCFKQIIANIQGGVIMEADFITTKKALTLRLFTVAVIIKAVLKYKY